MNINPFGPYFAGALRTGIASCFINGKITEVQIDFGKEVILGFREAEIEHMGILALGKEEVKRGCSLLLRLARALHRAISATLCSAMGSCSLLLTGRGFRCLRMR